MALTCCQPGGGDGPPDTPTGALGFDCDGARFSHVGARATFEVLVRQLGLADNTLLRRIAVVVHCLGAGDSPVPEAAGLERLLAGLRALHADDAALAAAHLLDAFYVAPLPATAAPP